LRVSKYREKTACLILMAYGQDANFSASASWHDFQMQDQSVYYYVETVCEMDLDDIDDGTLIQNQLEE
jgi:hypothetical protein